MPLIPAYLGEAVHVLNRGRYRFKPTGEVMFYQASGGAAHAAEGIKSNPVKRFGGGGLAARLFIGLNVGDTPTYSVDDIVDAVGKLFKGSVSFVAQKGIYVDENNYKTFEDSVQIIIIDSGSGEAAFKKAMVELGEELAARFQQKEIVLELQKKGIVDSVYGVTPKKKKGKR